MADQKHTPGPMVKTLDTCGAIGFDYGTLDNGFRMIVQKKAHHGESGQTFVEGQYQ